MSTRIFKSLSVAMAAMMVIALFTTGLAGAQGTGGSKAPGTWVSSINIQNVGTGTAHVVIDFRNTDGTTALSFTLSPDIGVGGSRSLYVPTDIAGLGIGQYAVVVSSDQDLEVVANQSSSSPYTAGSYNGIKAINSTLYFPQVFKKYFGFDSEVVLQNTDAGLATISLTFYNAAGTAMGTPFASTIAGNGYKVFSLADFADSYLTPGNGVSGDIGNYSLKVVSDKALAGVANVWTSAFRGEMSDYNAYADGATTVYVPAIYRNYFNFYSALIVQNLDTADATVQVTYGNGVVRTTTIGPSKFWQEIVQFKDDLPSGNTAGVFSAKVVSTNDKKIVAIVNTEDKSIGSLASYNAPMVATTAGVNCPVVLKKFYDWFSAATIQNVGTLATNITIKYACPSGVTCPDETFSGVQPNGTVNIIQLTETNSQLADGQSVAATVTSSNSQPLVAVVQENALAGRYNPNPGDYLLAYTCSPK